VIFGALLPELQQQEYIVFLFDDDTTDTTDTTIQARPSQDSLFNYI
jgi:hypothetical protein